MCKDCVVMGFHDCECECDPDLTYCKICEHNVKALIEGWTFWLCTGTIMVYESICVLYQAYIGIFLGLIIYPFMLLGMMALDDTRKSTVN